MSISNVSSPNLVPLQASTASANELKFKATLQKGAKASDEKLKQAALQFEQIMIRQMLEPLEKSMTKSFGGESNSPMIGGMIISSLSQSMTDGGGLGLASVIEEALRRATPALGSASDGTSTQPNIKNLAAEEI